MNPENYTRLIWPGLVAAMVGIYGYWAGQRQLVSSRPKQPSQYDVPDPLPPPGVITLHSRMWEDPLSAAHKHWKGSELAKAERDPHDATVPDAEVPDESIRIFLWIRKFHWIRKLLAGEGVKSAAAGQTRQSAPPNPTHDAHYKLLAEQMKQQFCNIVGSEDYDTTLCLPVFVPGGPYAEDKERRKRMRYAVTTALAEADYHLEFSRQMSYVVPGITVRVMRGWQELKMVVPIKLYRQGSSGPEQTQRIQILVLWINESQLGLRPLLATHRILNEIFSDVRQVDREKLRIAIIGPASSDTLSEMVGDLTEVKEHTVERTDHWKIASYRPLKTIEGFAPMWPGMDGENREKPRPVPIFSPRATQMVEYPVDNDFAKMYRVVGTDAELADVLGRELKARGALPGTIVLITEHDTTYGRAIRKTFDDAFYPETPMSRELLTFRILRGIDGQLPALDDATRSKSAPRKSADQELMPDLAEIVERRPEGRSQYDYLKRLP